MFSYFGNFHGGSKLLVDDDGPLKMRKVLLGEPVVGPEEVVDGDALLLECHVGPYLFPAEGADFPTCR